MLSVVSANMAKSFKRMLNRTLAGHGRWQMIVFGYCLLWDLYRLMCIFLFIFFSSSYTPLLFLLLFQPLPSANASSFPSSRFSSSCSFSSLSGSYSPLPSHTRLLVYIFPMFLCSPALARLPPIPTLASAPTPSPTPVLRHHRHCPHPRPCFRPPGHRPAPPSLS